MSRRKSSVNPRVLLRGLILIASLVAIGYGLKATGVGSFLDAEWIDAQVRAHGALGGALFVLVGALFTAVGLPRQVVSFLGGYAFGLAAGTLWALLATAGGCVITFFYARLLGRDLVAARFPRRVRRADEFLRQNPFAMTLLIRLLPLGSNLVTSLAGGVSSAPAVRFIAGSTLGFLPQTVVFALIGSGINLDPALRITVGALLFVVSGLLGAHLYRRYRHGRTFDETIEAALEPEGDEAAPNPPGAEAR